ncbi:MAG: hypothetical protein AAB225_01795 [Acidobacteriota bacterium]
MLGALFLAVALSPLSGLAQAPNAVDVVRGKPEISRADEQDEAILRRILYGHLTIEDLTEQQAEEMVAAARRRFDRQQARVEEAKKLVEEGALPRLSLTPFLEELDRRRKVLDQAVSRARLLDELAGMARTEVAVLVEPPAVAPEPLPLVERYDGDGRLPTASLKIITLAFQEEFGKPLPVSASGATALHRALGFDHRGRIDVGLDPDQPEGVWLRDLLRGLRVPYYAFRTALRGRSTGPHIHIGPPSEPLRGGG